MISKLAERIADRGKTRRSRVGGMLVHTTGGGIVAKAKTLGADPEAFAVDYYATAGAYPNYLVAPDGSIYSFCDEMAWSAHAKWEAEEKRLYALAEDRNDPGLWTESWFDVLGDDKLKRVMPGWYDYWLSLWRSSTSRGTAYASPLSVLWQVGGRAAKGPNEAYVGVELVGVNPFTFEQHEALAALFADVAGRHLFDPASVAPGSLPQAWLCSHSDISPMRRWDRGGPWDPRAGQLDWRLLENLILGAETPQRRNG